MPHFMTTDVKAAIGETAGRCLNRSLFVSKYPNISHDGSDKEAKRKTIDQFSGIKPDPMAFDARNILPFLLIKSGRRCLRMLSRLQSRMIINQAGGIVENAGLCIDAHLGLPYIPGSSLKGVVRAAARETGADPNQMMAVFGWSAGDAQLPGSIRKESYAGSVSFLPAYPQDSASIAVDVLTCHYPEYYRAVEKEIALDNEDPLPNFFPVVEAGALFSFSLVMTWNLSRLKRLSEALKLPPDFDPLALAFSWLSYGLSELGVGAKTSAGYGWFMRDMEAEQEENERAKQIEEKEEMDRKRVAGERAARLAEEQRIAAMSPKDRCLELLVGLSDEQFAAFAKTLSEKGEEEQRAFIELLSREKKDRWKVWKKRKPDLAEAIKKIADMIGEVLP